MFCGAQPISQKLMVHHSYPFNDDDNNNNNNNNNNIKKVSERATMTEIQKISMLGSVRILRKVLSV